MFWKPFDYKNFECGLFWLRVETTEYDIDTGGDGRTSGEPTGEVSVTAVMARVEEDSDGSPYFEQVDEQYGKMIESDRVTHVMRVSAPELPVLDGINDNVDA